jgi:hypothetical protein
LEYSNEQRLRQLGREGGLLLASALGSIARVRMLQANEATPNSNEQVVARKRAKEALNEILRTRRFVGGGYYWAESMIEILRERWAEDSDESNSSPKTSE